MNNFQKNVLRQVPPWELCKLIPDGEFSESLFIWVNGIDNKPKIVLRPWDHDTSIAKPAPTFDEILDELHKCQEDVFVKWSETAYQEWLVNAYSHGRNEDYQAHDQRKTTAAIKVWLKNRGIEPQKKKAWFHETGNMIEPWFADGKIRLLQESKISVIGKYEFLPVRPAESVTIRNYP